MSIERKSSLIYGIHVTYNKAMDILEDENFEDFVHMINTCTEKDGAILGIELRWCDFEDGCAVNIDDVKISQSDVLSIIHMAKLFGIEDEPHLYLANMVW